jgi:hypothetical protein
VNDPVGRRRPEPQAQRRSRLIRRALLTAACLLAGLATGAFLATQVGPYVPLPADSSSVPWEDGDLHRSLALLPPDIDFSLPAVPVYPYSVVPGGVWSPSELEKSAASDPVVSLHYRNFDFHRARVVLVTEDKSVFVSYRMANKIFWTKKKVHLHRGEKLITDGKITARARCANQVSETAHNQTSPEEPAVAKLEQPIQPRNEIPVPVFESALTPPNFPGAAPGPPPGPSGPGFWLPPIIVPWSSDTGPVTRSPHRGPRRPPQGPPTPPPIDVPEPEASTLVLAAGLALSVAFKWYRKHLPDA